MRDFVNVVGYKSWRNPELGSWFMRDFVNVVGHNAHGEHLADMLTQVSELLVRSLSGGGGYLLVRSLFGEG